VKVTHKHVSDSFFSVEPWGRLRDNLPLEGVGSTFVHEVGKSLQVYTVLLAIGFRMILIVQSLQYVSTNSFKLQVKT